MKKAQIIVITVLFLVVAVGIGICQTEKKPAQESQQQQITPKKAMFDTDYDGKVDRTEYYNDKGQIEKVEISKKGDGIIDERVYYKDGKAVKAERDANRDGKMDVFIDF